MLFAGNRVWAINGNNGLLAFTIQGPGLTVFPSGNKTVVSWSTNNAGMTLQSSPSLSPQAWSNAGSGTLIGDRFYLTNSSPAGSLVYRLVK